MQYEFDNTYKRYFKGKYIKNCAFKPCGVEFAGPLNRKYCGDTCKERQKTWNRKKIAQGADGDDLKIKKAVRIIDKLYKPNNHGFTKIPTVTLIAEAFPFDLPTKKVKIDGYRGEMNGFGVYCFAPEDEYFLFYKFIKS
jgi:hypothetical protein